MLLMPGDKHLPRNPTTSTTTNITTIIDYYYSYWQSCRKRLQMLLMLGDKHLPRNPAAVRATYYYYY